MKTYQSSAVHSKWRDIVADARAGVVLITDYRYPSVYVIDAGLYEKHLQDVAAMAGIDDRDGVVG